MKWKSHLINYLTLTSQVAILFVAWWEKYLIIDNAPLLLALAVFVIGVVGGVIIWHQNKITSVENDSLKITIIIIGSIVVTAGAYMAFVPVIAIFMHSGVASILLVLGIFSPSIVPKLLPNRGELNNA